MKLHRPRRPARPSGTSSLTAQQGFYWLYGVHPVQLALANPRRQKGRLLATPQNQARFPNLPTKGLVTLERAQLDHLLGPGATHQGIALEVAPLPATSLDDVTATNRTLLMLDQVTDPHNIGAILRSAAAFGCGGVIVQDRHSPRESATMAKVSAGGIELVPLVPAVNLSRALRECREAGYQAIGLDGAGTEPIGSLALNQSPIIWVLGAEGTGLRRLVAEQCDRLVRLPIDAQIESLNVSVAAALALYHQQAANYPR